MLRTNFLSKNFSQLAKITFTNKSKELKNIIYFASEGEIKSQSNKFTILINSNFPIVKNDIEKNKFALIYPFQENDNFLYSERLIYTESPNENLEKTRNIAAKALRLFSKYKLETLHVIFSENFPLENRKIALNSLIMANYAYKLTGKFKSKKENNKILKEIKVVIDSLIKNNFEDFKMYASLANANLYTRELTNMRPNICDCDFMEKVARNISKGNSKVNIEVIKGEDLLKNNLNLIHSVGKSGESEPRMIILSYKGKPKENKISHAIVGKGVTFDTGGLSLKRLKNIKDMYYDKHGACNALATFKYAINWNLPMNLVCAIGLADNSIDALSYKPSDIITSYKGLTVEITNTDAEGRLVLCDILAYLQDKYKPDNIIDIATLTGACKIALVFFILFYLLFFSG